MEFQLATNPMIDIGERAVAWVHNCDCCDHEHTYASKAHDEECVAEACNFCDWIAEADPQAEESR